MTKDETWKYVQERLGRIQDELKQLSSDAVTPERRTKLHDACGFCKIKTAAKQLRKLDDELDEKANTLNTYVIDGARVGIMRQLITDCQNQISSQICLEILTAITYAPDEPGFDVKAYCVISDMTAQCFKRAYERLQKIQDNLNNLLPYNDKIGSVHIHLGAASQLMAYLTQ